MNRREVLKAGLLAGVQALVSPLLGSGLRRLLGAPADGVRRLGGFQVAGQIAVWDPAVKNYATNVSYDYGGRLQAAWLDR